MYEKLRQYQPVNEQEMMDKQAMLDFIDKNADALDRSNLVAHVTSSAIVVNETLDKVLFAHHNIYDSYGWIGGHNDGDGDCLRVALKEAHEETGLVHIRPYNDEILGVDIIHVTNHIKKGLFVPDHLHLNVTYLLVADETETPAVNPEEHSAIQWFSMDEVFDVIDEERMIPIYTKLFQKVEQIREGTSV
ncbi:NUDIX hydrolase [Candidatus Xianfuyuplasma coldseepsis]|uniref:NUDIX domain-containing protein n=1 Tax=Candidatus Xianfuyuplasma coldseepsis TaxID=2782163 RepID=A0A7L7KRY6_9MOLU|nr:NUDIX domain-containing protein [Xianfuyuplasma coldseepsis]QMS85477.1 NUDIX domain-containing protein [Xianfuyuplasma coldseepsis]